jgi:translation initiation factor 1 (eIF-1/SUI1)
MDITRRLDPADDEFEQDFSKIHLRVIKRNNKKCVTTIEGLYSTNIDYKQSGSIKSMILLISKADL